MRTEKVVKKDNFLICQFSCRNIKNLIRDSLLNFKRYVKYNINKKLTCVMIKQTKQLKSLDNTITNDDTIVILLSCIHSLKIK